MILSRNEILEYIRHKKVVIEPFDERNLAQISIDLRLDRIFMFFSRSPTIPTIRMSRDIWGSTELWEHYELDSLVLEPGRFVLAQTYEKITIPNDLIGWVEGRSSWARLGISIHITAPKVDPGFSGRITLEMANIGEKAVELQPIKDQPAQMMFMRLSQPVDHENLYGSRPDDIFQGQTRPIPGD